MPLASSKVTSSYEDIRNNVNTYLDDFCIRQQKRASSYGTDYEMLWENIRIHIGHGGKRLRPYLVDIAYRGYKGSPEVSIIPIAAAWELLHTCLLIHDDIIDRDDVRHNHLNISGIYKNKYQSDSEHLALSTALLAGDALLGSSNELILVSDFSAHIKNQLILQLNKALFGVIGGELEDTVAVLKQLQSVSARHIATSKTAEYSIIYPLISGAIAAEVSDSEIKKLTQFGTDIGLAYQLKDDIIGVFGDQKQTGKSNESDIYEKKRTVLLQETHNRVHADDKAWLENQFMSDASLSKDDVQRIKHLIQESGARHSIEKEIRLLHAAASQQLANLKMQQPVKKELYDFLEKLMVRHV